MRQGLSRARRLGMVLGTGTGRAGGIMAGGFRYTLGGNCGSGNSARIRFFRMPPADDRPLTVGPLAGAPALAAADVVAG